MNATDLLVAALKNGERVRLSVGRDGIAQAHTAMNRLEKEHGLSLGRLPCISGSQVYFIVWADGIGTSPLTIGKLVGKDGQ